MDKFKSVTLVAVLAGAMFWSTDVTPAHSPAIDASPAVVTVSGSGGFTL